MCVSRHRNVPLALRENMSTVYNKDLSLIATHSTSNHHRMKEQDHEKEHTHTHTHDSCLHKTFFDFTKHSDKKCARAEKTL